MPTEVIKNTVGVPVQDGEEILSKALPTEKELTDKCKMPEIGLPPNLVCAQESSDSFQPVHVLYCGNVELDIAPSSDDATMQMLCEGLKMYGIEFHDVVTSLELDQSTINLFLKTPINLIAVLESIDGVTVYDGSSNDSHSQEPQRLNIRLRH